MEIASSFTDGAGNTINKVYRETDPLQDLEGKTLHSVHGFCFCQGKLVVIFDGEKGRWAVPGGGIEQGETVEEAVTREVAEETNMRVLHQEYIGYQDLTSPKGTIRQTRSFCIVEPIGEFEKDPGGEVTEIKLVDPATYKDYFDWGEIGDRVMAVALQKLAAYEGRI